MHTLPAKIMILLPALLAWSTQPGRLTHYTTYSIHPDFCDVVLPHFTEDTLLSWTDFKCEDVHYAVRRAFDEWQVNSLANFREVSPLSSKTPDIVVTASTVDDTRIAQANVQDGLITFNQNTCWYTDRRFCAVVREYLQIILFASAVVWLLALGVTLWLVSGPVRYDLSITRFLSWTIVFAIPIVLFTFPPCFQCYDFVGVLMHEVGHLLGFRHSDDDSEYAIRRCGCGSAASKNCSFTEEEEKESVMYTYARRVHTPCLSRDDVDGLRSLYGGDCHEKVWCYYQTDGSSLARVAVALVYAVNLAWWLVIARNTYRKRKRILRYLRRTPPPTATPPPANQKALPPPPKSLPPTPRARG